MPAKKGPKPKRVPHANETPLKALQPGHGAVERAKGAMWSSDPSSSPGSAGTVLVAAAQKPAYKPTATVGIGMGIGIGRGGGGGGLGGSKKTKKKVPTAVSASSLFSASTSSVQKVNPDASFFDIAKPTAS